MKKIITYGTYDLFHEGHYNMLKRAKAAGDYLIVGVTGDNYDIGRGKLSVKDSLATRIQNVKDTGFADEIIVEEYLGQKISDIIKYDIDAFVIGDDWKGKFDHLSNYCEMIYLERTQGISSTQIREENFKTNRIGIITDQNDDNQIVSESKLVSGFKVSGVFSPDYTKSVLFRDKYQLDTSYSNEEELFADTDIIYIRTAVEDRYNYVKTAVLKGKHVICDPPFALETDKQKELFELAKSKNVILMDNAKMVNINTFNQLLWMTQAGIIGDIIKFNCSVSKKNRD
ncbi:MAG: adenylyltransferase/cytidyltransferase family protein, partial [Eubacterium sp.]|nr:adenylyltransferase/cytidyltransferase family protein [Candidatus Colimonas fimequi]